MTFFTATDILGGAHSLNPGGAERFGKAYRYLRRKTASAARVPRITQARWTAQGALAEARAMVANSHVPSYVPGGIWRPGFSNPVQAGKLQWIEHPESHFRFVGLVHKINSPAQVDHTGWFLDDFEHETVSGVVYQLTGRNGGDRYLAGYADPWNTDKDGHGPALMQMEIIESLEDAIRAADGLAETMAENERDYQTAHRAGREARTMATNALTEGKALIAACRDLRAMLPARRGFPGLPGPLIRDAIRDTVAAIRKHRAAYEEAKERRADAWSTCPGWTWNGADAWRDGYREGEME